MLPAFWDHLAVDVIPAIIEHKPVHDSIRVWGAGFASGEEVYSLSMILAEAFGPEVFSRRVKIYPTTSPIPHPP